MTFLGLFMFLLDHTIVIHSSFPSGSIMMYRLCQCFFLQLFCMSWSLDGSRLATFSKDQILALYDPRSPGPPVCQQKLDLGGRGARLVWLEDKVIALSGFNRYTNSYSSE